MGVNDHGELSTYNNYDCRCKACKAANAEYHRKRRANLTPEQKRYAKQQRIKRQQSG